MWGFKRTRALEPIGLSQHLASRARRVWCTRKESQTVYYWLVEEAMKNHRRFTVHLLSQLIGDAHERHRIHPVDLMSRKTADTCIVDVRTAAEVKAAGLPDCCTYPARVNPERLHGNRQKWQNGSCIYLLCQAGRRAEMAAEQLAGKNQRQLCIIEGGMEAVKQSSIELKASGRGFPSSARCA